MLAPTGPSAQAREPLRGLNWKEQTHGLVEESEQLPCTLVLTKKPRELDGDGDLSNK